MEDKTIAARPSERAGKDASADAIGSRSAVETLDALIHQAEQARASDIHVQMRGQTAEVSFRLDGVLTRVAEIPAVLAERVVGRIKYLARLKTYQDSLPQDGRIDRQETGAQNDIRVATYPTVTGEKIVLRLFNVATTKTLNELEFPGAVRGEVETILKQPSGLLLLTGPAGSGKTTTIYACLRQLVEFGGRQIITVEDPVEQIVPSIMQTEVSEARGLNFAKAARHLLRQDPQVLVIGEIRDEETANIAVRASLTGHLVISTLHAGSCHGVLERLLVMCHDHSAVASSVELILNQRLVRRLCAECAGRGCSGCLSTGFRGRLPLVEALQINDGLRRRIAVRDLAGLEAQPSLAESARELERGGFTNHSELQRVLGFNFSA